MAVVSSGVKYLKINPIDSRGNNYSSTLQNADSIRINYVGTGSVQYDILTAQQKSNYFILGVIPTATTSSTPGRYGFSLRASASYNINDPSFTSTPTWDGDYDMFFFNIGSGSGVGNAKGDALSFYMTGSSGYKFNAIPTSYTFRKDPNEELIIQFTCSIKNDNGGVNAPFTASLFWKGTGYFPQNISLASASVIKSTTQTFSGSISSLQLMSLGGGDNLSGSYFYIQGINTNSVSSLTASFAELNIIAAPLSTPSSSLTTISPPNSDFNISDDNALLNNATTPRYSNIYQDIDYSTGLVPTNFNLLISGNADVAPIQDSNYTATGWSNSRYNGSRVSSPDFNITI